MNNLKEAIIKIPKNFIFQLIMAVIFIIPAIETIGQYINSGFMSCKEGFPIIFWPGTKVNIFYSTYVWISMLIMISTYIGGIVYLLRKKEFGIVVIIGIIGIECIGFICFKLGNVISNFAIWNGLQGMPITSFANKSIFSKWSNPLWEEIVFRGIPLILLLILKKKLSVKTYKFAVIAYLIIPSIMFSVYHIPNHGTGRIVDTFIAGVVFAYLGLKYSFFAPLVIHYFVDIIYIITISSERSIPKEQIIWLTQNTQLINKIFYDCIFSLIVIIPAIITWNMIKLINTTNKHNKLNM